jgi:SAM-dependent methyltransferase
VQEKLEQIEIGECPACGGSNPSKRTFHQNFYVEPFSAVVRYAFRVCEQCGFLFVSNPPSQASLNVYYAKAKTLRRSETDELEKKVLADQFSFIQRRANLQPGASMLEIGCDAAQFLDHVRDASGLSTYFLELGEEAVRIIEQHGRHKNYLKETPPHVDVLVMRHTLEHLVEPLQFLQEWRKNISSNGKIFIEVPDWTLLTAPTDLPHFEHVNYFSLPSLATLLDRAGFHLEDFEYKVTPGYHTSSNRVLRILAGPKPESQGDRVSATFDHIERNLTRLYVGVSEVFQRNPGKRIAFYAASWTTSDILLNANIDLSKVTAIFDSDPRKQGTLMSGISVVSPERVRELNPDIVVVNSSYEIEIEKGLREIGFSKEIVLSSKFTS